MFSAHPYRQLLAMHPCIGLGQWVAIIGACGGLGHVGCQYAKAMGLKVCAVDFGADKKTYAIDTLKCDAYVDIKDRTCRVVASAQGLKTKPNNPDNANNI